MDVIEVIRLGLEQLKWRNPEMLSRKIIVGEELEHSMLHDLKNMVVDLQNLKGCLELLDRKFEILGRQNEHTNALLDDVIDAQMGKIKIPHRCPVCNGSTFDEEGALCHPCDGRGIVWG